MRLFAPWSSKASLSGAAFTGAVTMATTLYVAGVADLDFLTTNDIAMTGAVKIDQTPTAGATVPTHHITLNLNGVNYRIPCLI